MENILLQYMTDVEGNKTAVVIPIAQWRKLLEEFNALREYQTLEERLHSSVEQMLRIKEGTLPKRTLSSFLDEC